MRKFIESLDIQFFAEGGAADGGEGAADAVSSQPQTGESDTPVAGEKIQGAANDAEGAEKKLSFDELIKGEYKDDYKKHMNGVVKGRLREERAARKAQDNIINTLMVRYGAESPEDLAEKLNSDEALESIALERGESVDTVRELERLRAMERSVSQRESLERAERAANEQVERWQQEAQAVKETFPDFDLETELQNPQFRALITTKNPQYQIGMADAYKLLHHDELMKAAESAAAEKIAKNVNARASRPTENGLGNQNAAGVKNDVSKLTKKERAELARRAARGERIEF